MTFETPAWTAFEDGSPPGLPGPQGSVGRVVVLLTAPKADARAWTPGVATGLVRDWVAQGLQVVLADARVENPTLHAQLGLRNEEGLTDALLWGASVQHVARPLSELGYYLITAGTAVPDGAAALQSTRWSQLCAGFQEAGVTIVALVSGGKPGAEAVLETATDVVVLATPDDDVGPLLDDAAEKLRGIVGEEEDEGSPTPPVDDWTDPIDDASLSFVDPPLESAGSDATPAPTPAENVEEGPPDHSSEAREIAELEGVEELLQDPLEATPATVDVPEPVALVSPEPTSEEAAPARPTRTKTEAPKDDGRGRRTLFVVLLVILALILAAWMGVLPGFGGEDVPSAEAIDEVSATVETEPLAAASPPTETSPLMGYSLAMGAYQDAGVAGRRVAALSRSVAGAVFASVPVEVDGRVFYRVLAGPAADSADAARLTNVVAQAASLDPSSWVIRPTPRAFQLGEMEDLEAARRRVTVLSELGVPAYVMAVDYSDGSTRFRVYAGAYGDEIEASYLAGLLAARGLGAAALSNRIGRLPE